jgi:hypothetical protein
MPDSRADLVTLLGTKVITGGRQTTAQKVRDMIDAMLVAAPNINDDKDVADGYLGLDSNNLVDITHIAQLVPAGLFLRDDGTWAFVPGMGIDIEESGVMSGSTYSLAQTPDFIYGIYKNGVRLTLTADYSIGGNTVTFVEALDNDTMVFSYKY